MTINQADHIGDNRQWQSLIAASGLLGARVAKVAVSYKDRPATVIYDDAKANVNQLTSATTNADCPSTPGADQMLLQSTITCPHCDTAKAETMPTDACQFFYECTGCGTKLKPKAGDCCVFCSYGSVPCPPIQAVRSGESGAASCCE
jgi:hypothetical protein